MKRKVRKVKQSNSLRSYFILLLLLILPVFAVALGQRSMWQSDAQAVVNLYVSPTGSDSNTGTSASSALKTIQSALNKASPGTTINIAPGIYREKLTTVVNGTADSPIILKGSEVGKEKSTRYKTVLYGTGRIVNIDHSYYRLEGFTIDGQEKLSTTTYPTDLNSIRSFKDSVQSNVADGRLIYIGSAETSKDITGVVITNMFLHGAGGECVRMRNNAVNNTISDSVIEWCGMYGKGDDTEQYKYHNGEGVYIGTSPKSTDQPMAGNDQSSNNIIRDSTINTFGSECFQVKENAHDNSFINNICAFNDEPTEFLGSAIELRGHNNSLVGNTISQSKSVAFKMKSDSTQYDKGGNSAQNNTFSDYVGAGILNDQTSPQGIFCGNTFSTSTIVQGNSVGNPTEPCVDNPTLPANGVPPATQPPVVVTDEPLLTPTLFCLGTECGAPSGAPTNPVEPTTVELPLTSGPTEPQASEEPYATTEVTQSPSQTPGNTDNNNNGDPKNTGGLLGFLLLLFQLILEFFRNIFK